MKEAISRRNVRSARPVIRAICAYLTDERTHGGKKEIESCSADNVR